MKIRPVYIALRTPAERVKKAIRQVLELRRTHPAAVVSVDALSLEGDRVCIYVRLDVPVNNSDPSGIAALQFAHSINLNMYEYMPTYTHHPQEEDREIARQYLASIMDEDIRHQDFTVEADTSLREGVKQLHV